MLDGGCMDMSLSAGNFRWVVLWMCLETLPTQEVSPEGGSSCLKLGSGISSRFSHPGHGLRYDKVTKMSQNVTKFYCKHWPCGLSTIDRSTGAPHQVKPVGFPVPSALQL